MTSLEKLLIIQDFLRLKGYSPLISIQVVKIPGRNREEMTWLDVVIERENLECSEEFYYDRLKDTKNWINGTDLGWCTGRDGVPKIIEISSEDIGFINGIIGDL